MQPQLSHWQLPLAQHEQPAPQLQPLLQQQLPSAQHPVEVRSDWFAPSPLKAKVAKATENNFNMVELLVRRPTPADHASQFVGCQD